MGKNVEELIHSMLKAFQWTDDNVLVFNWHACIPAFPFYPVFYMIEDRHYAPTTLRNLVIMSAITSFFDVAELANTNKWYINDKGVMLLSKTNLIEKVNGVDVRHYYERWKYTPWADHYKTLEEELTTTHLLLKSIFHISSQKDQ